MKVTCGIFLFNNEDKFLIGHPTNHAKNIWTIPKGLRDPGETDIEAAKRELYEETNIDYNKIYDNILMESHLGEFPYKGWINGKPNKDKVLSSFLIDTDLDFKSWEIKCESMVNNSGNPFPEIDDFKWVTFEEAYGLLHKSQIKCFPQISRIKNIKLF